MDETPEQDSIDLHEYIEILRLRKWTVIIFLVLTVAAAMAASFAQTPLYRAEARLLIQPQPAVGVGSTGVSALIVPETEAEIVSSEPVAALVQEQLDSSVAVGALLSSLDVGNASLDTVPTTGSSVLVVGYTSEHPDLAAEASNAFATGYLTYRRQQSLQQLEADIRPVQNRLDAAAEQLNELSDRLEAAQKDPTLATALETQRNILVTRMGVLQQRLDDLEATRSARRSAGTVIEQAGVPSSPASPNHLQNAILSIVIGLFLGVGLAFLRERLDNRLKGRADLERVLEAPVLATIPRFEDSKREGSPLIAAGDPHSAASEAYRSLRTNLQFITSQRSVRAVLVTSPSAEEGKTATCANLGVAFAQSGRRVILISADMRKPTLERYFSIGTEEGLSTWLSMQSDDPSTLIRDPGIPNLRIVASGPVPPNPGELLTSPRVVELISVLEANSDIVLVDSPPVLAVADASILASHVGGTLLVVDSTKTARSTVTHARDELQKVGATVIGAVLNALDPASARGRYYGGTYYGASYSAQEPSSGNGSPTSRGTQNSGIRARLRLRR